MFCSSPQNLSRKSIFLLSNLESRLHWVQSMEVEMDLPFDDKRDNPEGEGKPSSNIDGLWKPLAFVERSPDIFVKVYKVDSHLVSIRTNLSNGRE